MNTNYHPFFTKTNIVNFLRIDYRDIERMFIIKNRCVVQVNGRAQSISLQDLIPVMVTARAMRGSDLNIKPVYKGVYYVENCQKNSSYQVHIDGNCHSCDCEDFKNMNEYINTTPKIPCKHILATRQFLKKEIKELVVN